MAITCPLPPKGGVCRAARAHFGQGIRESRSRTEEWHQEPGIRSPIEREKLQGCLNNGRKSWWIRKRTAVLLQVGLDAKILDAGATQVRFARGGYLS